MTQVIPARPIAVGGELIPVPTRPIDAPGAPNVIPDRVRPSPHRAAAAALLVGDAAAKAKAQAALATMAVAHLTEATPATPASPGDPAPSERHLRVVDTKRANSGRRRTLLVMAGVSLAAAVALLLVYAHVVLAQRQFQLDRLNNQVQQEQVAYQNLRLQVAQLGSPQQIISTAEGQLGMVQPSNVTYLPTNTSTSGSPPPASTFGSTATSTQAPAGDADWPLIKSQLAGSP